MQGQILIASYYSISWVSEAGHNIAPSPRNYKSEGPSPGKHSYCTQLATVYFSMLWSILNQLYIEVVAKAHSLGTL